MQVNSSSCWQSGFPDMTLSRRTDGLLCPAINRSTPPEPGFGRVALYHVASEGEKSLRKCRFGALPSADMAGSTGLRRASPCGLGVGST